MTDFNAMTQALVSCDTDQLIHLVKEALDQNVPANEILNKGLIAGMDIPPEDFVSKIKEPMPRLSACPHC